MNVTQTFYTLIDFVAKGGGQTGDGANPLSSATTGATTSDIILIPISIIMSVLFLGFCFSLIVKRHRLTQSIVSAKHSTKPLFQLGKSKRSFMTIVVVLVSALIASLAIAAPITFAGAEEGDNFSVSEKITATIDLDTGDISFETGTLANGDASVTKCIETVSTDSCPALNNALFTIKAGDSILYNERVGNTYKLDALALSKPQTTSELSYQLKTTPEVAKSLVGTAQIKVNTEVKDACKLTGIAVDKDGKAIAGADVKFTGEDQVIKASGKTDSDGKFEIYVVAGIKGTLQVVSGSAESEPIKFGEGKYTTDKDCEVGSISVLSFAKEPAVATGLVYNKSEQTGVSGGANIILIDNTATNAGDYRATATPKEGFTWEDGSTISKTYDWSIGKANAKITLGEKTISLEVGDAKDVQLTYEGESNLTVSVDKASVATAKYENNKLTVTGVAAGDAVVYLQASECDNYFGVSETLSVKVNGETGKVTLSYSANGGTNPPASVSVDPGTKIILAQPGSIDKEACSFAGWNTSKYKDDETHYDPGDEFIVNEDTTIYAEWDAFVGCVLQSDTSQNSDGKLTWNDMLDGKDLGIYHYDQKTLRERYPGSLQKGTFEDYNNILYLCPDSNIVSLRAYSVQNAKNLHTAYLLGGLTKIEGEAFAGCEGLNHVEFSNQIIDIQNQAFEGCSLTDISLPASLQKLGNGAFYCSTLRSVNFEGTVDQLQTIFDNSNNSFYEVFPSQINKVKCSDGECEGVCPIKFLDDDLTTELSHEQVLKLGDKITKPDDPVKEDSEFLGWKWQADNEEENPIWDFNRPVSKGMILVAQWKYNYVTVNFVDQDGNKLLEPQKVLPGNAVTKPNPEPTKEFYSFAFWTYDNGQYGYEIWDFTTLIDEDLTLVATWDVDDDKAEIDFYDDNEYTGKIYKTDTVSKGSKISAPSPEPTKSGYKFSYWAYMNNDGEMVPWDFEDTVDKSLNLYAIWVKDEVSVYFVDSNKKVLCDTQILEGGEKATKPDPDPQKEGYTFKYWQVYQEEEMTNEEWNFDTPITDNTTLEAVFEQNTDIVVVSFVEDEWSSTNLFQPQTITAGTKAKKPADNPIKQNYRFEYWAYSEEGDAKEWDFNNTVNSDLKLFPIWTQTHVSVTFEASGNTVETQNVKIGECCTEPEIIPEKEFYVFKCWGKEEYDEETWESKIIPWDFTKPVTEEMTLYADWTQTHAHVEFVDEGDYEEIQLAEPQTVQLGETCTKPAKDPVKFGYAFKSWATREWSSETGEYIYTDWDFTQPVNKDLKLYATWTNTQAIVKFADPFDWDAEILDPVAVDFNTPCTKPVPDPTRTNYVFKCWSTREADPESGEWIYTQWDFATPVTGNMTLYAEWTQTHATVKFSEWYEDEEREIALNDSQIVQVGDPCVKPAKDPKKTDYAFTCWCTREADPESEEWIYTPWNFDEPVTKDMSLFAQWTKTQAKVQFFDSDEESYEPIRLAESQIVKIGEPCVKPAPDPQKEGFTFKYWAVYVYDESAGEYVYQEWNFTQAVSEDMTLYAVWDPEASHLSSDFSDNTAGSLSEGGESLDSAQQDSTPAEINVPNSSDIQTEDGAQPENATTEDK